MFISKLEKKSLLYLFISRYQRTKYILKMFSCERMYWSDYSSDTLERDFPTKINRGMFLETVQVRKRSFGDCSSVDANDGKFVSLRKMATGVLNEVAAENGKFYWLFLCSSLCFVIASNMCRK